MMDYKTKVHDYFDEEPKIWMGKDAYFTTDNGAILQGVAGIIKTRIGECGGVGMEGFGCDVWMTIGEKLTAPLIDQIKYYIREAALKVTGVKEAEVEAVRSLHDGRVSVDLHLTTIYGTIREEIIIG